MNFSFITDHHFVLFLGTAFAFFGTCITIILLPQKSEKEKTKTAS